MPLFDDEELEEYYRRIEALTFDVPGAVRRYRRPGTPASRATPVPPKAVHGCPTPDKAAYRDENEARAAILAIRATSRRTAVLRCYPCACGSWHLTSGYRA